MLTLPPDVHLRCPTMDDLDAVLHLMLIRDRAEYRETDMTEEHIRTFWQSPGFKMDTNAWAVTTHEGRVIGYASVWRPQPASIYTYLTVLPEFHGQGIRTSLLDVVERRARELVAETPLETRVTLNTHVAEVNEAYRTLFAQAGFSIARGSWRMEIEMHEPPPPPHWPQGIAMRPFVPGQDTRAVYEAQEEAFQDTWGHTPWDFSVWEHWYTKREGFDPTLWFLACEGQQIAGMCLCNYWIGDGFVDTLAVRRSWRRLGLGLALLHQSFGAFYQRQTRTVKLMVDAQNLTGATRLYERAGMHVTQLHSTYEKELRPGKELRTTTVTN
jgi:mycothiol synthase